MPIITPARAGSLALLTALAAASTLPAQAGRGGQLNQYGNPQKLTPRPTVAAINAADLRTRIYIFADDSMQGRQLGRKGNMMGTDYIAGELKRLRIQPGGWDGSYFQNFGFVQHRYIPGSKLSVNGTQLRWNEDYVAVPSQGQQSTPQLDSVQVIFGGIQGDSTQTITPEQAAGKLVLVLPNPNQAAGGRGGFGGRGAFGGRGGAGGGAFAGALAIATVNLDGLTLASREELNNPQAVNPGFGGGAAGRGGAGARGAAGAGRGNAGAGGNAAAGRGNAGAGAAGAGGAGRGAQGAGAVAQTAPAQVINLRVTTAAAEKLLGRSLNGATAGTTGGFVTTQLRFVNRPTEFARNVIGVIPGSDPVLKHQYVVISAHNDHVGFGTPVDHDSARAAMTQLMEARIKDSENLLAVAEVRDKLKPVNVDSLRKIRPARLDSINNGADDDGSGSMGILEIAEAIQLAPVKPKRSIVFVWHTGEEAGMDGSRGYVADPSVPLDSIVAAINVDMIGRGRKGDLPGGGDTYLGVVGSKVLSADLGQMVVDVNKKQPNPFNLDYRYDSTNTWGSDYQNIYRRSDHINYANAGIPIAFFFTGLHADYHKVTDEPEYIDYPHYAKITRYLHDLVMNIANRPERIRHDPKQ